MREESRFTLRHLTYPLARTNNVRAQTFVLPHSPTSKGPIQMKRNIFKGRTTKVAVVTHPAPNNRAELSSKIAKRPRTLEREMPPSDCLPHRLQRQITWGRKKTEKRTTRLIQRFSWPERIAKKIKLNVFIVTCSVRILAIHYPRLLRMNLQTAFAKPLSYLLMHIDSLLASTAMDNPVISIPTEWNSFVSRG